MRPLPPFLLGLAALAGACANAGDEGAAPAHWQSEWPETDFSRAAIDFDEISEGGPPRDGIPSIDAPRFGAPGEDYPLALGPNEPVISLALGGEARGYPLRILTRHEIVNDDVGGVPVAVTYCPLCDSAVVFDRRLDGRVLEFGTTGKLRHSDLVMYDRQTESWWQQFLGLAIVGELKGSELEMLPSRVESLARFRARFPDGRLLLPPGPAGIYDNPYVRYDSRDRPYPFFKGEMPEGIAPMARVVAVGGKAWTLRGLAEAGRIEADGLVLSWHEGMNSALDSRDIARGRDIGNVVVQRRGENGLEDVPYDVTFAFAFHAFHPEGEIVD
ncbi:MAG: DUF3179 domain-containing protein [Sphingomonadaceae bacterium]